MQTAQPSQFPSTLSRSIYRSDPEIDASQQRAFIAAGTKLLPFVKAAIEIKDRKDTDELAALYGRAKTIGYHIPTLKKVVKEALDLAEADQTPAKIIDIYTRELPRKGS